MKGWGRVVNTLRRGAVNRLYPWNGRGAQIRTGDPLHPMSLFQVGHLLDKNLMAGIS